MISTTCRGTQVGIRRPAVHDGASRSTGAFVDGGRFDGVGSRDDMHVWYTHHMTVPMASAPSTARVASDAAARRQASAALDALDDRLVSLRRVLQRPGYRRRLLQGLSVDLELGVLRLLRVVQRADGSPSIGEVAEVLTVDPSTASRVVDRAASAGYLERHPCESDRRRTRLSLSSVGTQLLDEVTARRRDLLAEVIDDWQDGDLEILVGMIDRLLVGFGELEGPA